MTERLRIGEPRPGERLDDWQRHRVAPGIWALVRPDQARILRFGAMGFLAGVPFGGAAFVMADLPGILFLVFCGVGGVLGQLAGLVVGVMWSRHGAGDGPKR